MSVNKMALLREVFHELFEEGDPQDAKVLALLKQRLSTTQETGVTYRQQTASEPRMSAPMESLASVLSAGKPIGKTSLRVMVKELSAQGDGFQWTANGIGHISAVPVGEESPYYAVIREERDDGDVFVVRKAESMLQFLENDDIDLVGECSTVADISETVRVDYDALMAMQKN